jgi:methionyl-tRNA formyltransferase
MRLLIALVLVLTLGGCAHLEAQKVSNWARQNKPLAESGQMKWSDYYTQLFDHIKAVPDNINGKGFYLQASATMIDAAKAFEEGRASKDEFDSFQRQMIAKEAEYQESVRYRNAQQAMNAAMVYNQFLQTQAMQAQAWRSRPVNCTSYGLGNTVQTNCY